MNWKLCTLQLTLGREQDCSHAACPFWEEGGAALDADCGIERLGLDLGRRDLAAYLLELRLALESARSREEISAARATLAGLVPPDLAGC
jgi:hypothetical protein